MSPSCTLEPGLEPLLVGFKTGQKEGRDGRNDDGVTFLWKVLRQLEEAESSSSDAVSHQGSVCILHTPQGEAACSCDPVTRLLPAVQAPVSWSYALE